ADDSAPPIELPAPLRPYSDAAKVIGGAKGVIGLLADAKFEVPAADSPFGKPPCNDAETAAIYRGLTLVQASYFIFGSKVERGFESTDSPHVFIGDDFALLAVTNFGALVRPGREMLVAAWDPARIKRLLSLVATFRD